MRIARVVGNVVSTIKDAGYYNHKLMIIEYLDEDHNPDGSRQIAFDCADAGVGDIVLVCIDGGAANIFLGKECIADVTICGVVDYCTYDGKIFAGNTAPKGAQLR